MAKKNPHTRKKMRQAKRLGQRIRRKVNWINSRNAVWMTAQHLKELELRRKNK